MKRKFILFVTIASLTIIAPVRADEHAAVPMSADAALVKLKEGNQRFATSKVSSEKPTATRRAETAMGQHPFAIIVGCADSRTSPELLFDQNLGDIFVIRTAGNVIDDHSLGSIEYAVEHLGTRLIVVLGHSRCGAVSAAVESDHAPGHINSLVRDIRPAVKAVQDKPGDHVSAAVAENAREVAARIKSEGEFGELSKDVKVTAAVYDLDSGKVEWLK